MSQPNQELHEFLLYLAKNANEKRYFPFPAQYRATAPIEHKDEPLTTTVTTTTITTTTTSSTVPIITTTSYTTKKLDGPFDSYTPEEYAKLKADLDLIPDNLSDPPKNIKPLIDSIINTPVQIAFHQTSFKGAITEFEFRYDKLKERVLNHKYKTRWYLFHGSPLGNWHSIVRNGIRSMSNTVLSTNGAASGPGVYLSTNFMLACNYGYGTSFRQKACVAVVEIFVDPEKYSKGNGVYVIPDDTLLLPRYLYFVRKRTTDIDGVLALYKQIKEKNINTPTVINRVGVELMSIKDHIEVIESIVEKSTNTYQYVVILKLANSSGILLDLNLDGYPFVPPLIQFKYKISPTLDRINESGIYLYDEFNDWTPMNSLDKILLKLREAISTSVMEEKAY